MITLGLLILTLFLLSKYEDKIGRNGHLFSILLMMNLLIIGIVIWDLLGLSGGIGGSPYLDYYE